MKNLLTIVFIILIGFNAHTQDDRHIHKRPPIIDMLMHTGLPHAS